MHEAIPIRDHVSEEMAAPGTKEKGEGGVSGGGMGVGKDNSQARAVREPMVSKQLRPWAAEMISCRPSASLLTVLEHGLE